MMQSKPISIAELCSEFELLAEGNKQAEIHSVGSLKKKGPGHLHWLKSLNHVDEFEEGALIISKADFEALDEMRPGLCYLISNRLPRLVFALILQRYFDHLGLDHEENCVEDFRSRRDIHIGTNVFIGRDVEIGSGSVIHSNVVIYNRTKLGNNVIVNPGCTLGTEGLGYISTPEGQVRFPQIGGLRIGDDVFIGPNSTIRRGALDDTVVNKGSKIGSFCNIGHNCSIGEHNILTSNVIIAGSVHTGKSCYFGISSSIKNGVGLGNNVTVGQAAVVVKSCFEDGYTLVGSPAQPMDEYKRWSRVKKRLISTD